MTINPESVKAYARELLEAEERGRREERAKWEPACKLALAVLPALEVRSWPFGHKMKADAIAALKAVVERQGEAMEGAGG